MPKLAPARGPGQVRRVADRLSEIPGNQLACRGGRHLWPYDQLETGKPIPRGLTAIRQSGNGVWMLQDTCTRCGKTRWCLTLPMNIFDTAARWHYIDPKDWVKLSADLEVTKREVRAENIARNASRIFT